MGDAPANDSSSSGGLADRIAATRTQVVQAVRTVPGVIGISADDSSGFDFNALTRGQRLLASAVGVIFSALLVYFFWRVVQLLLRFKALRRNLRKLPQDELIRAVGSEENANAIRSNTNDIWLNLTMVGFTLAYGLGAMVGFIGSLATFGGVVLNKQ